MSRAASTSAESRADDSKIIQISALLFLMALVCFPAGFGGVKCFMWLVGTRENSPEYSTAVATIVVSAAFSGLLFVAAKAVCLIAAQKFGILRIRLAIAAEPLAASLLYSATSVGDTTVAGMGLVAVLATLLAGAVVYLGFLRNSSTVSSDYFLRIGAVRSIVCCCWFSGFSVVALIVEVLSHRRENLSYYFLVPTTIVGFITMIVLILFLIDLISWRRPAQA